MYLWMNFKRIVRKICVPSSNIINGSPQSQPEKRASIDSKWCMENIIATNFMVEN